MFFSLMPITFAIVRTCISLQNTNAYEVLSNNPKIFHTWQSYLFFRVYNHLSGSHIPFCKYLWIVKWHSLIVYLSKPFCSFTSVITSTFLVWQTSWLLQMSINCKVKDVYIFHLPSILWHLSSLMFSFGRHIWFFLLALITFEIVYMCINTQC